MKKYFCLLLVVLSLSLTACTPTSKSDSTSESEETITAFYAFLSGKLTALDKDGSTISIEKYLQDNSQNTISQYAIYDMNGDEVPELIIKTRKELSIFWLKENVLTLWHNNTSSATPLNNKAILSTRIGDAPQHIDYVYIILDYQGNEFYKIEFSEYAPYTYQNFSYPEIFLINNIEVNKDIYDSIKSNITSLSSDKISWKAIQSN